MFQSDHRIGCVLGLSLAISQLTTFGSVGLTYAAIPEESRARPYSGLGASERIQRTTGAVARAHEAIRETFRDCLRDPSRHEAFLNTLKEDVQPSYDSEESFSRLQSKQRWEFFKSLTEWMRDRQIPFTSAMSQVFGARNEMLAPNLAIVHDAFNRHLSVRYSSLRDDVIQEGYLILLHYLEYLEPHSNFSPSNLRGWILPNMIHAAESHFRAMRVSATTVERKGESFSPRLLRTISLDAPVQNGNGEELGSLRDRLVAPEVNIHQTLDAATIRERLLQSIDRISGKNAERDRQIVLWMLELEEFPDQNRVEQRSLPIVVAAQFSISRARVEQILEKFLIAFRKTLRERGSCAAGVLTEF